jgi:hypothetical protein
VNLLSLNGLAIRKHEHRRSAAEILSEKLRYGKKISLKDLHQKDKFETAWDLLGKEDIQTLIYSSKEPRERLRSTYEKANKDEFLPSIGFLLHSSSKKIGPELRK